MGTMCSEGNFYPRSPCGERRQPPSKATDPKAHFYPRSPCGERPEITDKYFDDDEISIHALLAESDALRDALYCTVTEISIHALLAESDPASYQVNTDSYLFLSTLSLRRATQHSGGDRGIYRISIHALLAESDAVSAKSNAQPSQFLSTLSLRRATKQISLPTKVDTFLSTLSLRRATGENL